jgi:hypothetical protein
MRKWGQVGLKGSEILDIQDSTFSQPGFGKFDLRGRPHSWIGFGTFSVTKFMTISEMPGTGLLVQCEGVFGGRSNVGI